MRLALAFGLLLTFPVSATTAWLSPDSWPGGLADQARFDQASAAEILQLAAVIDETEFHNDGPQRWAKQTREALGRAWVSAGGKALDWSELATLAKATKRDETHHAFWTEWVAEQVRLARLFPKTTSEIFPLEPGDSLGGDRADRAFELTFDDGPTAAGGTSDTTIDRLRSLKLPATFFVLGDRLLTRPDARGLYAGFCVASHGKTHVAHTELGKAKDSYAFTRAQLASSVDEPRLDLFRPPYGQRSEDFAAWLEGKRVKVVLWNIDSQDWRSDAVAARVAGRVLALMLVQRHGTILFHDVHPIAREAVSRIAAEVGTAVSWQSCDS